MRKGSKMNRTVKATVGLVAIAAMSLTGLAACGGSSADDGKGKGLLPELQAGDRQPVGRARQEIHRNKTGVQVKVQTAALGHLSADAQVRSSPRAMRRRSSRSTARSDYQNWKGYTADLKDTGIYNELNNKDSA